MKILMINVVCGVRSTGRLCTDIAEELDKQGHEVRIAYGREKVPEQFQKYAVKIGTDIDVKLHALKARMIDGAGFGSRAATEKFIRWVRDYDPDVIHLHNLHGYYINLEVLFRYLKTCGKKIIWTLHDCWAFTGHCAYFDYAQCTKWKTGCGKCPEKRQYPESLLLDRSAVNYEAKRQLFAGISGLHLVTPSEWLKNLVKESFMADYPVEVNHNGVNTDIFKVKENSVKKNLHCEDRHIVLGVAAVWDRRKGYESFLKLSGQLDSSYQIVLVGLNRKQLKHLPPAIIGIEHTNNAEELAELYSAADVYFNPTLEDNYPTTNLEAIACGTPVISYDTGGSVESAKMYGVVVPKNDLIAVEIAIERIALIKECNPKIDNTDTIDRYVELYREIGKKSS